MWCSFEGSAVIIEGHNVHHISAKWRSKGFPALTKLTHFCVAGTVEMTDDESAIIVCVLGGD